MQSISQGVTSLRAVPADVLADDAPSELAVTRFDLQRAGHSLPHVRQTLPDVQHWDVHERHLDRAVGPQLDVVHSALVGLHVAAAEQLRRPVETHTRSESSESHFVPNKKENAEVVLD